MKQFEGCGGVTMWGLGMALSLHLMLGASVSHGQPSMALVPSGTFTMGSPTSELGRDEGEIQHQVTLTQAIFVSTYEVTQSEWEAMMGWNESFFQGPDRPVDQVTWFDAVSYCNQRSLNSGLAPAYTIEGAILGGNHITSATVTWNQNANGYRLLTEAEWEYACRATSTSAFCNGDITVLSCALDPNLDQVGWYCANNEDMTHDVGGKDANAWGLRDMHGNVFEWCWDWYGIYSTDPGVDPSGPESALWRIMRGGADMGTEGCRSAFRWMEYPGNRDFWIGLRLARAANTNDVSALPPPDLPALLPVSPNPVSRDALIRFDLPAPSSVDLAIYDVAGCRVAGLLSGSVRAGQHQAHWSGLDEAGHRVQAGVYFCRLQAAGHIYSRALVLIR